MAVTRLPVAVGILAKNEAADLPDCLRQCDFAHETIVLVDTASTDDTEAIARAAGATVLRQTLRSFAEARNAVLAQATAPWVLFLDADERLTPELRRSVEAFLAAPGPAAGAWVHREDVFLGRRLRHGDANVWLLRLGRTDAGTWQRPVHEVWEIAGPTVRLDGVLEHYSHRSVAEYLRKMAFYTDLDAQSGERAAWWQLVAYPVAKFVSVYVVRLGVLDGWPGLVFALLNARYSFTKRWKLYRASHGVRP